MKKLIALLAALALCLSMLPAALAELPQEEPLTGGSYVTIDSVGLKFWLPDEMKPHSLPHSGLDSTYLGYYMNEDRTATLCITLVPFESTQITIDDVAQQLRMAGVDKFSNITIHELPCLFYSYEVEESLVCKVVTVLAGKGCVVEFAFLSCLDQMMNTISESIQATE